MKKITIDSLNCDGGNGGYVDISVYGSTEYRIWVDLNVEKIRMIEPTERKARETFDLERNKYAIRQDDNKLMMICETIFSRLLKNYSTFIQGFETIIEEELNAVDERD